MNHTPPAKCACGRRLRDPDSVARGYGPVCWRRLNGRPARIRTTTSTDQMPGQTELVLTPLQPTLLESLMTMNDSDTCAGPAHTPQDGPNATTPAGDTRTPVPALSATPLEAGNGIPTERPTWAVTHGACGKWWTGNDRSHCGACHLLFSSLSAFDRHRRAGNCLPPATVGLVARQKPYGPLWGWPGPDGGMGAARGNQPAE